MSNVSEIWNMGEVEFLDENYCFIEIASNLENEDFLGNNWCVKQRLWSDSICYG